MRISKFLCSIVLQKNFWALCVSNWDSFVWKKTMILWTLMFYAWFYILSDSTEGVPCLTETAERKCKYENTNTPGEQQLSLASAQRKYGQRSSDLKVHSFSLLFTILFGNCCSITLSWGIQIQLEQIGACLSNIFFLHPEVMLNHINDISLLRTGWLSLIL